MVQIFSNLASFCVLEGNIVISRPLNDSVRVGNILPLVGGSTVQKCIKSRNSSINLFRVH